jgi:hypothetical protein
MQAGGPPDAIQGAGPSSWRRQTCAAGRGPQDVVVMWEEIVEG